MIIYPFLYVVIPHILMKLSKTADYSTCNFVVKYLIVSMVLFIIMVMILSGDCELDSYSRQKQYVFLWLLLKQCMDLPIITETWKTWQATFRKYQALTLIDTSLLKIKKENKGYKPVRKEINILNGLMSQDSEPFFWLLLLYTCFIINISNIYAIYAAVKSCIDN